ncbi:hypothetical protein, partial [Emticicia agri]
MKKLTVWVLALVLFSCGTKEILSPDLSKDITGVYQVYLIGNGVKTISMPTPSDTISIALQPIDKQRC